MPAHAGTCTDRVNEHFTTSSSTTDVYHWAHTWGISGIAALPVQPHLQPADSIPDPTKINGRAQTHELLDLNPKLL